MDRVSRSLCTHAHTHISVHTLRTPLRAQSLARLLTQTDTLTHLRPSADAPVASAGILHYFVPNDQRHTMGGTHK